MEQDQRAALLSAARASVAQQQAYFAGRADQHWRAERGQARIAAAVLELSRIDEEQLSAAALAASQALRELRGRDVPSYRAPGPAYGTPDLPQKLVGDADADAAQRAELFTGKGGRNGIGNGTGSRSPGKPLALPPPTTPQPKTSSRNGSVGQSLFLGAPGTPSTTPAKTPLQAQPPSLTTPSPSKRTPLRTLGKSAAARTPKAGPSPLRLASRPVEPYWRHLFVNAEAPTPQKQTPRKTGAGGSVGGGGEEGDGEVDDPTRDPMTIITELKKEMKFVPDPNTHALRIALQFLRIVYGDAKGAGDGGGGGGGGGAGSGASGGGTGSGAGSGAGGSSRKRSRAAATPPGSARSAGALAAAAAAAGPATPGGKPGARTGDNPSAAAKSSPAGPRTPLTPASPGLTPKPTPAARANASPGREAAESGGGVVCSRGGEPPAESPFGARQQRAAARALAAARAADARGYLERAARPTDPDEVLDRRTTADAARAEARKLKFMADDKKER
jgi:hypothetical protein